MKYLTNLLLSPNHWVYYGWVLCFMFAF